MSVLETFIRRPVATSMLSLGLVTFGALGLSRLPVRELPDIDPPIVTVTTVYPGASAEVIESEVTERLEESIASVDGIKIISSTSREAVSQIEVEFNRGRDVDVAATDVRDRVARVRARLPQDVLEPVITKADSSQNPIMWIALFSDEYSTLDLTRLIEERIKDRLQTVEGVSSILIGGEKRFAMRLRLDSALMAARGVTVTDVENALRSQNVELPSGRVEGLKRELAVQLSGQLDSVEDFENVVIRQDGVNVVRMRDIARVEEGVEDERTVARYRGKPAVGIGVVRQQLANTLEVAKGIKAEMDRIIPTLPEGVETFYAYDESVFIEKSIKEVWETLGIAFLLVLITIFIFLRNVRATIIPMLSIPVSVLTTFGVLYFLGFSINIFTLLALVLAIGIVVDDAIVVLENIYRHMEEGLTPFDAARKTMKEIGFAIITITSSLIAVFLPLTFLGGLTGRLLLEFSVSLCVAVATSGLVALTLSPMVSSKILKPLTGVKHGRVFMFFEKLLQRVEKRYEKMLTWSLDHRWKMVGVALLMVGSTVFFYLSLAQDFLPEEDKGRLFSIILTPEGSTSDYTDAQVKKIESILESREEVDGYFTAVALARGAPGQTSQAFAFVRLREGERPHVRDMVAGPFGLGAQFMSEVPGALAFPIVPKTVGGFSQPFQLVLQASDLNRLDAYAQDLRMRFMGEGFFNFPPRSTFEITKPELRVKIDRDRANALNVSILEISRTLQVLLGGLDLSTLKRDGREFDVIAQLDRKNRLVPSDLERIFVRSRDGQLVQLSNVVSWEEAAGPNAIERFQRRRATTIEGSPRAGTLGSVMQRTEEILAETLPPDFSYEWRGEARNLRETTGEIYFFILLASLVVYMVLAAQFESLKHPFTVMIALLLAAPGALGLLWVLSWVNFLGEMFFGWANYAPDPPAIASVLAGIIPRIPAMNLNIFSQVGFVLLIALVTKTSILLVEFANQGVAQGLSPKEAMLKAGIIRLRPILMTSLATIAGILPIALGLGEASEARRPLGVVAVGGMVSSTFLTLLVVPVIYVLVAGRRKNPAPGKAEHTENAQSGELIPTNLSAKLAE